MSHLKTFGEKPPCFQLDENDAEEYYIGSEVLLSRRILLALGY